MEVMESVGECWATNGRCLVSHLTSGIAAATGQESFTFILNSGRDVQTQLRGSMLDICDDDDG